ncbi:MAG: sensor histidine kinase [Bacteroidetes bacterium]|nr:MAG: sensor histidine kinase [Bacteroidota bacterium]
MSKKVIWTIIGLMTMAVVGVVWLQMNLIRTSILVNEEKFDANVFTSLNAVVRNLEEEEDRQAFLHYENGYANIRRGNIPAPGNIKEINIGLSYAKDKTNGETILLDQLRAQFTATEPICNNCKKEINNNNQMRMAYLNSNSLAQLPLKDRINIDYLKETIQRQLNNNGVKTNYHYGVYAKKEGKFIIMDDKFTMNESMNVSTEVLNNINATKYKVFLYPDKKGSSGMLMMYFPDKTRVVWSSMWGNLLGIASFTTIILLCFAYTVNVIFRQKKISEMKTDFINNMTHEFKTPIATISLAADSITSPRIVNQAEKVSRFANIIKQENKRMNSQVEKVLQMAVIDKEEFSLKLADVDLSEVIKTAVENITLQVEKKSGTVSMDLNADNSMIKGDYTHISNVINNLLDNANKYSPEKPEISISTRNVANGVEVIISDKGVGMDKEARKHIFDKFYRVHTGNLHDIKGFGLGLSYVKAIMTAHKGHIDVKSELGNGSSFILVFPYEI